MKTNLENLSTCEWEYLLEALRRDVRANLMNVHASSSEKIYFQMNARRSIRILEALNPKANRMDIVVDKCK
jgi:hypothetical protein